MMLPCIALMLLLSSTLSLAKDQISQDPGTPNHRIERRMLRKSALHRRRNQLQRSDATPTNELDSYESSLSGSSSTSRRTKKDRSSGTAITSLMGCASGKRKIKFSITLDRYGPETTWELKQLSTNKVVMKNSRTYSQFDTETVQKCVIAGAPEEQYELTLYDEGGDGICCQRGKGNYTLSIEESGSFTPLVTGGSFKSTKFTHLISVRSEDPVLSSRDNDYLEAHNTRRKYWHEYYGKDYVPLKWSGELAASSKLYAEQLLDTCNDSGITHDKATSYGENLAKNRGNPDTWGKLYPADKIVARFIDREVGIGWPKNFHLTQALWRASKYVGCGEAVKPWGRGLCRMQVCRYSKPGNCFMSADTWETKMMLDDSGCYPDCPPEGCF